MRRFLREIGLYSVPIVILILFLLFPGFYSREFGSFDQTIALQREQQTGTIGMAYNEQTPYYKTSNANYYKADVIALGTSRVMQFRSEFFQNTFYNCGGAVEGNYGEYKNFLRNLNYSPKVLLVGLDAWAFNDEWNKTRNDYSDIYVPISKIERRLPAMVKNMYSDLLEKKWTFHDLNNFPDCFGFAGRINGDGFLPDGSYSYTSFYRDPVTSNDFRFRDTMNRIEKGINHFEFGDHIDKDTLRELEGLFSYCKDHGIFVIGFSAPFAPAVYQRMTSSGNHGYLPEIAPACKELFEEYGFEYYDFSDLSFLNLTDDYYLDGFHGSDIVYAFILKEMIREGSSLAAYLDQAALERRLEMRYNTFVFDKPVG